MRRPVLCSDGGMVKGRHQRSPSITSLSSRRSAISSRTQLVELSAGNHRQKGGYRGADGYAAGADDDSLTVADMTHGITAVAVSFDYHAL